MVCCFQPGPMIVVWSVGKTDHTRSGYNEIGYKIITFIQEDQKNVTTTNAIPTTIICPVNNAVVCLESCLLLAASLFLVPLLRL